MDKSEFVGRDFLKLSDFTPDEVLMILDVSADFKARSKRREPHCIYPGYTAAALFEKKSTRTRTSFQAACAHLGMSSFYMRPEEMQLGRGEPISDTARVIDRYCDVLFIRTFGQEIVDEFARYMEHPVINALTDQYHPCQALADLLTIREHKGAFKGLKVAYAGDVWNVCQSLMTACAMTGMDYYLAYPEGYDPYPEALDRRAHYCGGCDALCHGRIHRDGQDARMMVSERPTLRVGRGRRSTPRLSGRSDFVRSAPSPTLQPTVYSLQPEAIVAGDSKRHRRPPQSGVVCQSALRAE